jgi:hypothetical protein
MSEQRLDVDFDPDWACLYRVAAAAAFVSAALIVVAGGVFVGLPPPGFEPTAANTREWFAFFQAHRLAGIVDLDLVMVVDNVLAIPVFLALYVALRRVSVSWTTLGVVAALVGTAGYFAVNPAFSMLSLSDQYLAAPSDADRAATLAAGQTVLAIYKGTGFNLYIVLVSAAGVVVSAVMLRSERFGKVAGGCGIAANLLNPGMFLPVVGLYVGFAALLPLLAWYALVGRAFLRVARAPQAAAGAPGGSAREPASGVPLRQVG